MSQDTWEIVQNKELNGIELQLALQCAPLITGLKISNLLIICREDFPAMKEIVRNSHISWYLLLECKDKIMVLLYHERSLEHYLAQKDVLLIFRQAGYQVFSLKDILEEFKMRYQKYMENRKIFPHEMGLLLGYPVEDVNGFIKYNGNGFLCTGYWKVYEDKDRKLELFENFENAKDSLIQLLSSGISMEDIFGIYNYVIETKMIAINR